MWLAQAGPLENWLLHPCLLQVPQIDGRWGRVPCQRNYVQLQCLIYESREEMWELLLWCHRWKIWKHSILLGYLCVFHQQGVSRIAEGCVYQWCLWLVLLSSFLLWTVPIMLDEVLFSTTDGPQAHENLEAGAVSIRRTKKSYARSAVDLCLEQTVKVCCISHERHCCFQKLRKCLQGGGVSLSPSVVWPCRSSINLLIKEPAKQLTKCRIRHDNADMNSVTFTLNQTLYWCSCWSCQYIIRKGCKCGEQEYSSWDIGAVQETATPIWKWMFSHNFWASGKNQSLEFATENIKECQGLSPWWGLKYWRPSTPHQVSKPWHTTKVRF